jgi:hypothetical protein
MRGPLSIILFMITHIPNINAIVDPSVSELITSWVGLFQAEMNAYYKITNDITLFRYNERALLGFFINSLIRDDKEYNYIPIHEYSVYNGGGAIGRADLLIISEHANYLIECKRNISSEKREKEYDKFETYKYLIGVLSQAKKYYYAENEFFNKIKKSTFLIALVFDTVRFKEKKTYLAKIHELKFDIENYFHVFFYSDYVENDGLSMYGLIEKIKYNDAQSS